MSSRPVAEETDRNAEVIARTLWLIVQRGRLRIPRGGYLERRQKVDFTAKYYKTPARFVRKRGSGIEITKAGLDGKSVGVQRATIHENFLRDNYGDIVSIKAYATQEEANLDFGAGRVDLLLADSLALREGFLKTPEGRDAEFVGPDFTDRRWFGEGAGIAVRKGESAILDALNRAIATIRNQHERVARVLRPFGKQVPAGLVAHIGLPGFGIGCRASHDDFDRAALISPLTKSALDTSGLV